MGHLSFVPSLIYWLIDWFLLSGSKLRFVVLAETITRSEGRSCGSWVIEPTTQTIIGNFCEPAVLSLVMESGAWFKE